MLKDRLLSQVMNCRADKKKKEGRKKMNKKKMKNYEIKKKKIKKKERRGKNFFFEKETREREIVKVSRERNDSLYLL